MPGLLHHSQLYPFLHSKCIFSPPFLFGESLGDKPAELKTSDLESHCEQHALFCQVPGSGRNFFSSLHAVAMRSVTIDPGSRAALVIKNIPFGRW